MSKIKYGLKNVHYAVVTETTNSSTGEVTTTYGTVKPWKGAVNLSLDASGEDSPFYADDGVYYMIGNNNGYSGDFESALIPEDVYTAVMGQTKDINNVYVETDQDVKKFIALMFEFTMDQSARRFVLYRCSLTRPSVASNTKGENIEAQTETVTITVTPRPDDGKIKAFIDKANTTAYTNWYKAVYVGSTPQPAISVPESVTLAVGESATLVADVIPAGSTVTWTSASTSIATVGESTGVVTAESSGSTIVTASITVSGVVYTGTTTVIVEA